MTAEPYLDELNTILLGDAFRDSLPLPAALDRRFEAALNHVLDNPGSLVRPRMVLQVAAAYGLDAQYANSLSHCSRVFPHRFTDLRRFAVHGQRSRASWRALRPCRFRGIGRNSNCPGSCQSRVRSQLGCACRMLERAQPQVMAYLEQRLGVSGLLNGQSLDLHYAALPHSRETTERIAHGKTVSLIRLTLVLPALLAGAPSREVQLLERISACWGLSYQIVDDLKDVLQSRDEAGKTVARDILLDRPNIAAAIGVSGAVERLIRLHARGRSDPPPPACEKAGLVFPCKPAQ